MTQPIKTYFESKMRALLHSLIIFVPLVLIVFNELFFSKNDSLYVFNLVLGLIVFAIIFIIIIYFIPTGKLEIYDDSFTYKRGTFVITSNWSEVNAIVFQNSRGKYNAGKIPSALFFDTTHGMTKLIDTTILKSQESGLYVDLESFINEIEGISGKKIKWGEISTKKYSDVNFTDFLKGSGIIK